MRRVVITGVGTVSPCGLDWQTTWNNVKAGNSGIGPITNFDPTDFVTKFAGECSGFNAEDFIAKREIKTMDRFIHLALGAAKQVMDGAGIEEDDPLRDRTATLVGVGMCGLEYFERTVTTLNAKGPKRITPYFIPGTIANLAPGQISMKYNLRGVSYTTTSACASGAHAIGEAMRWIQRGEVDAAVAGGAEAAVTRVGVGGFNAMKALSKRNDEPEKASRPWDTGRDGFVISEGAGLVFLEEREAAIKRGATIYAEVVGYGATADAYHLTQPAPEGAGAQRAMKMALEDAGINVDQVEYINAHGTSTPVGDLQEIQAIRKVLGDATDKCWVSSTKSMHGHLLGAAGGLEAVLTALALQEGIVPPTINLDDPDPEVQGVDLVPHEARNRDMEYAMSNSFGFGGTNCTLVLRKHT